MAKKRSYSTKPVESISVEALAPFLDKRCVVALDVAKRKFVGSIASDDATSAMTLFRFEHPKETPKFLAMLQKLRDVVGCDSLKVAMEPTGTYGDAVRAQIHARGVSVWMVPPKKTHDSQALFDDVPSMHDPKSAVHIARLCNMGLATEWRPLAEHRVRLRALVDLRSHELELEERCFGRLEALLARHWPEFGEWMDLRAQKSAQALLKAFPSPSRVRDAPVEAERCIRKASRSHLPEETIRGILASALASLGVGTTPEEEMATAVLASQASEARARADRIEEELHQVGAADEAFVRLEEWMGTFTAAAMITLCDPLQYTKARQLEKACGLNLREKSSGEDKRETVRLRITKRGPSLARKLLYLFALRTINSCPTVRAWYVRRKRYTTAKQCAVTAVMRKLVRAVFHVARGRKFDPSMLFDVRRLEIPNSEIVNLTTSATPSSVTI